MRSGSLTLLLLTLSTAARAEVPDRQTTWADVRWLAAFITGGGAIARQQNPGAADPGLYSTGYQLYRGVVGFDADVHTAGGDTSSALFTSPTPMLRLHLSWDTPDVMEEDPGLLATPPNDERGLGYVFAGGTGLQFFRRAGLVVTGYALVGLDGRRRSYTHDSFLWASPFVAAGVRVLHEGEHYRLRAGYEVLPPFFERVEHRLELAAGWRPGAGRGPIFGLRVFGQLGQSPVRLTRDDVATFGVSELQLGVGLEVGL